MRTSDKFTCLKYKIKQAGSPDVISITETWLSDGADVYFHLEGYNLFSVNRPHRVGGGILLYIKNDFLSNVIYTHNSTDTLHQILSVELRLPDVSDYKITVSTCYNPNYLNSLSFLSDLFTHLSSL